MPTEDFVDVPFTLMVPAEDEPGDDTGGIVTSYQTPGFDEQGEPVVLDRRLGSRVHVRVGGELQPLLEITDIDASHSGTPNPFGAGTLHVGYTVTNTGNVRLGAEQVISAPGFGPLPDRTVDGEPLGELLPGNSLTFEVEVPRVWPTVRSTARVELTPVPIRRGDVFDPDTPTATASVSTWAVPWTLLAILLLVIGGPLLYRWRRRQRKRREVALITKAVQDALAAQADTASPDRTPDADPAGTSDDEGRSRRPATAGTHTPPGHLNE